MAQARLPRGRAQGPTPREHATAPQPANDSPTPITPRRSAAGRARIFKARQRPWRPFAAGTATDGTRSARHARAWARAPHTGRHEKRGMLRSERASAAGVAVIDRQRVQANESPARASLAFAAACRGACSSWAFGAAVAGVKRSTCARHRGSSRTFGRVAVEEAARLRLLGVGARPVRGERRWSAALGHREGGLGGRGGRHPCAPASQPSASGARAASAARRLPRERARACCAHQMFLPTTDPSSADQRPDARMPPHRALDPGR